MTEEEQDEKRTDEILKVLWEVRMTLGDEPALLLAKACMLEASFRRQRSQYFERIELNIRQRFGIVE